MGNSSSREEQPWVFVEGLCSPPTRDVSWSLVGVFWWLLLLFWFFVWGFFWCVFFIVCFLLFWVFLRGRAAKTKHSVFIVRRCIHRIIELLRLSKTFKIINYWPRITATFTTRPCPLPYLHVFWVLPEMVTPPVSWEVCFSALQLFPWFFFSP